MDAILHKKLRSKKALEMYCSWSVMFDLLETNNIGNYLITIYENLKQTLFGPSTTKYVFTKYDTSLKLRKKTTSGIASFQLVPFNLLKYKKTENWFIDVFSF